MAKRMTKKPINEGLKAEAERHFEGLIGKADKEGVRTKLRNLHRACGYVVEETSGALSVPLVCDAYKDLFKRDIDDPQQPARRESVPISLSQVGTGGGGQDRGHRKKLHGRRNYRRP
jgi:hypothetical protein